MNILVTGACGYKGNVLVRKLLATGHTVVAFDIMPATLGPRRFDTITYKVQLKSGGRVVVFGAGGIALNLIQGATLPGAADVIAVH